MMSSRPAALETFRPNGRRSEGARTFWYGPQSFRDPGRLGLSQVPIEEGLEGVSTVPVLSSTDTADAPTKLSSHDLLLLEQTRRVLEEIDAGLAASPFVALDREAPFGGEGKGSGVPLTLSSGVGTQGRSRARARALKKLSPQSGLKRRKGEG